MRGPTVALTALALIIATETVVPEPIRSDDHWSIHPQDDTAVWDELTAGENLALGAPSSLQPEPAYAPTQDEDDPAQLTDGVLSSIASGHIWHDRSVVGWAYQEHVRVTLDLGELQSLGQLVMRIQTSITQQDTAPNDIQVALSADGEHFTTVRTLTKRTHPEDNPALTYEPIEPDDGSVHAFVLDLGYEARHVRIDFAVRQHLVMDEIAVMPAGGEVQQLPEPPGVEPEFRDNVFDRRLQYRRMTEPGNLIEGMELRYAPQPNYRLTTDAGDTLDLTDGAFGDRSDERIWFEESAVCWQHSPLVTVFADLGAPQPVGSVVMRLLGGAEQGGLVFPDAVRVLLSTDGDDYFEVAERHKRGLDDETATAWDLPEEGVAWVHNFRIPVQMRARYIAVQVEAQKQFICSDEMAIVRGPGDLPDFRPEDGTPVTIVTEGVAFSSHHAIHPICANRPIRTKVAVTDARSGDQWNSPCTLLIDLPDTVLMHTHDFETSRVEHDGRAFTRYAIPCTRGRTAEFFTQSALPPGERDVLYMYGDAGDGPRNERRIEWESIEIPTARPCERLHVSLAWQSSGHWYDAWPDGIRHMREMGFNAVGTFPRYWNEEDVPQKQEALSAARAAGMQIIQNESPAGAMSGDRRNEEILSLLEEGPGRGHCPSYRGRYYQAEHDSFAQHAAWIKPDYVFYDIEAYWTGAQEAPRCERCRARYRQGGFEDWDEFRAAMGREIHEDMKRKIDAALSETGYEGDVIYGSYRTMPTTPLNDGLFRWSNLYPDLLQIAMPSLYTAGDRMRVANTIAAQRAEMDANDIIPWLSTGTYGEYDPERTRDMILEAFANGARGITYYYYANFDPLHYKYHAEAIDIVAPIEDIFADGAPIRGLTCDVDGIKLCGMAADGEMALLVSNYTGVAPGTQVTISAPVADEAQLWDMHTDRRLTTVNPGASIVITLDDIDAHLYYVGNVYGSAIAR